MSLSARIVAGLTLGVAAGLFFGESAAVLQPIADIFIRLMQMTVLPYLVIALILGFGQLEAANARRIALRGGALLVLTWVLSAAVLTAMPFAFPTYQTASFFSNSLVEPKRPFSVAEIYFTENPFNSLSNGVVPAVVLFSSLLGIALIGMPDRARLLGALRVLSAATTRITQFIIGLTPLGVFAIAAVSAGTMSGETFARLGVYFIAFAAASLLLAFWVLPLLVTALTPFRYREVVGVARDALLTAFVASNPFIVLPILVERSKALLKEHGLLNNESDSAAEVMVPILFNFPGAGKLLTLLFIPFVAWMAGAPLLAGDYGLLFAVGIPSYFAKAQVALPFLLDLFALPHDYFQLYIPTTIISGKFDSLVTAVNMLVYALLGACAMGGALVLDRRRLLRAAVGIAAGIAVTTIGVRVVLGSAIDTAYHKDQVLKSMHAMHETAPATVYRDPASVPATTAPAAGGALAGIRERGTLRVGYNPRNLPFSFFNAQGELVGFDVELVHGLAEALGVRLELVQVEWRAVPRLLAEGVIDLMPSVHYGSMAINSMRLSDPYLEATAGLAVLDARRQEFADVETLRRSRGLKIGVPIDVHIMEVSQRRYFGGAEVELVPLDPVVPFFEGKHPEVDALLLPAEVGMGWTLLHPAYSVVIPQPDPVKIPYGFGLAPQAGDLAAVVDAWLVVARSSGEVQRAYDFWILGRGAQATRPRWSIARDVLGWVE